MEEKMMKAWLESKVWLDNIKVDKLLDSIQSIAKGDGRSICSRAPATISVKI